jgi:hypothetical protein
MELVYTNAANTTIQATLDDKETLGNLTGPGVFYVPTDPANAEYQDIIANNYKVSPYEPPPVPEPEPVSLPNVMPVDGNDATPKAYVDQQIAGAIASVLVRLDALEAGIGADTLMPPRF